MPCPYKNYVLYVALGCILSILLLKVAKLTLPANATMNYELLSFLTLCSLCSLRYKKTRVKTLQIFDVWRLPQVGFDLTRFPAIQAWLDQVNKQNRYITIKR